jgi:hypothetical protein
MNNPPLLEEFSKLILGASVWESARVIRDAKIPNAWIGAGAVRNLVWKARFGDQCRVQTPDIDVAYWEEDFTDGREQSWEKKFHDALVAPWQVRNQHRFASKKTGQVWTSVEDGIASWVETATTVAIHRGEQDELIIFAPYGLEDLFAGILRPTEDVSDEFFLERIKTKQWQAHCPALRIELKRILKKDDCYRVIPRGFVYG